MGIRVEENIWIELSDGCRLAARMWFPDGDGPYAAVLEYIPYRKRDGTRGRDEPMHGYFARNGLVSVRVDLRGSGDSDGQLADEYLAVEQDDAVEVIAWIARQPWSNGSVGMMGKSWGGFNAVQVAARRPPGLKAIIAVDFTDNRFTDDIHYMGGCLLNENLWWGTIMLAYQARPPDPAVVGAGWREQWQQRLDEMPFLPGIWVNHQRYDHYWKHGSLCEDYESIACPVLAVGGWADAYTNSVTRVLAKLKVPCRGIIGPWAHLYPQDGIPGPAIGFLQEAVRWWKHWLTDEDNDAMAGPQLRAYIQEDVEPAGTRHSIKGRWVGTSAWPSPTGHLQRLFLGSATLDASAGVSQERTICSPASHGKAAGEWMGAGVPGEHPADQRLDDGGALLFDSDVLTEAIDVLGSPALTLNVAADKPVAQVCVRLSDVFPDGRVSRVSYQVLNLTHRDGHESPVPLVPGTYYAVGIDLNVCGHRFAAGHRIRVSIASAYWPIVWPAPAAATLSIRTAISHLDLPILGAAFSEHDVRFDPPQSAPAAPVRRLSESTISRTTSQDHVSGETLYVTEGSGGLFGEGVLHVEEPDVRLAHSLRREMRIRDDDPLSAQARYLQSYDMGRDGWDIHIETDTSLRATGADFDLHGSLRVSLNGETVCKRTWHEKIPRDLL